jgi:hypothetical protein
MNERFSILVEYSICLSTIRGRKTLSLPSACQSKVSDFIFTASRVIEEGKHHQFAKILFLQAATIASTTERG